MKKTFATKMLLFKLKIFSMHFTFIVHFIFC